MPNFDQTGPAGAGPMTGRQAGICSGKMGWGWRQMMGFGRGRGISMGRGLSRYFGWGTKPSIQDQKKDLIDYLQSLKEEVADVEAQLADLDK